jgi:hypothetical protein
MEPRLCLGVESFTVTAQAITAIKRGIADLSQLADCISVTFPRVAVAKVLCQVKTEPFRQYCRLGYCVREISKSGSHLLWGCQSV